MKPLRSASVFTHRRPAQTASALALLISLAREAHATLHFTPEETEKHGLRPDDVVRCESELPTEVDLCFALGGDGTILAALRAYAGSGVPVFGVNFGEIGFLSTIDREEMDDGLRQAFAGEYDVRSLPAISLQAGGGERWLGINDVSMHRQPGKRVADLEYGVGTAEVGRVRCDGLVVATPAGSTGYNLANGGPVMAWGVEGFVVSFIAPHSLSARALVVAPADPLTIVNRSAEEPVDVTVDGRPVCVLGPGKTLVARFVRDQGALAHVPGSSFYVRLREKFGRLATGR